MSTLITAVCVFPSSTRVIL